MAMRLRDVPCAHTFDAIQRVYERSTGWPKVPHYLGPTARALGSHGKRYTSIRPFDVKGSHGFACRYHDTDVAKWTFDPSTKREFCEVRPWASMSTETFASNLGPEGVRSHMDDRDQGMFYSLNVDDETRVYQFAGPQMFTRDTPTAPFTPVEPAPYDFIDHKSPLVRSTLRVSGLYDFHKWLIAVMSLDQHVPGSSCDHRGTPMGDAIDEANQMWSKFNRLGLLADPNKWMHLRYTDACVVYGNKHSVVARIESIMDSLRTAILSHASLPPRTQVAWVTMDTHYAQKRVRRAYGI